jgi:hypothetical protein
MDAEQAARLLALAEKLNTEYDLPELNKLLLEIRGRTKVLIMPNLREKEEDQ